MKTLRRIFSEGEKIMLVFTCRNCIFEMNDGSQLWWCIRAGEFATEAMCGVYSVSNEHKLLDAPLRVKAIHIAVQ